MTDRASMLGVIRQELLSGLKSVAKFDTLRETLSAFPDAPVIREDHETAARCFSRCRAVGIAGGVIDFMICAVALRLRLSIFTLDDDFRRYARILPLRLHSFRGA